MDEKSAGLNYLRVLLEPIYTQLEQFPPEILVILSELPQEGLNVITEFLYTAEVSRRMEKRLDLLRYELATASKNLMLRCMGPVSLSPRQEELKGYFDRLSQWADEEVGGRFKLTFIQGRQAILGSGVIEILSIPITNPEEIIRAALRCREEIKKEARARYTTNELKDGHPAMKRFKAGLESEEAAKVMSFLFFSDEENPEPPPKFTPEEEYFISKEIGAWSGMEDPCDPVNFGKLLNDFGKKYEDMISALAVASEQGIQMAGGEGEYKLQVEILESKMAFWAALGYYFFLMLLFLSMYNNLKHMGFNVVDPICKLLDYIGAREKYNAKVRQMEGDTVASTIDKYITYPVFTGLTWGFRKLNSRFQYLKTSNTLPSWVVQLGALKATTVGMSLLALHLGIPGDFFNDANSDGLMEQFTSIFDWGVNSTLYDPRGFAMSQTGFIFEAAWNGATISSNDTIEMHQVGHVLDTYTITPSMVNLTAHEFCAELNKTERSPFLVTATGLKLLGEVGMLYLMPDQFIQMYLMKEVLQQMENRQMLQSAKAMDMLATSFTVLVIAGAARRAARSFLQPVHMNRNLSLLMNPVDKIIYAGTGFHPFPVEVDPMKRTSEVRKEKLKEKKKQLNIEIDPDEEEYYQIEPPMAYADTLLSDHGQIFLSGLEAWRSGKKKRGTSLMIYSIVDIILRLGEEVAAHIIACTILGWGVNATLVGGQLSRFAKKGKIENIPNHTLLKIYQKLFDSGSLFLPTVLSGVVGSNTAKILSRGVISMKHTLQSGKLEKYPMQWMVTQLIKYQVMPMKANTFMDQLEFLEKRDRLKNEYLKGIKNLRAALQIKAAVASVTNAQTIGNQAREMEAKLMKDATKIIETQWSLKARAFPDSVQAIVIFRFGLERKLKYAEIEIPPLPLTATQPVNRHDRIINLEIRIITELLYQLGLLANEKKTDYDVVNRKETITTDMMKDDILKNNISDPLKKEKVRYKGKAWHYIKLEKNQKLGPLKLLSNINTAENPNLVTEGERDVKDEVNLMFVYQESNIR